jgi:hypothetical protein
MKKILIVLLVALMGVSTMGCLSMKVEREYHEELNNISFQTEDPIVLEVIQHEVDTTYWSIWTLGLKNIKSPLGIYGQSTTQFQLRSSEYGTSAKTYQEGSVIPINKTQVEDKETFIKLQQLKNTTQKKSRTAQIWDNVIAGFSTLLIGVGVGVGSYYAISATSSY